MANGLGEDWTAQEVLIVVADYLLMFRLFLNGQQFNKSEHRRRVQQLIRRTEGSIEFKHQNISAVLRDLEMPWLPGYAPRGNYQQLLAEEVVQQIEAEPDIDRAALLDTERPAVAPPDVNFSTALSDAPKIQASVREPKVAAPLQRKLKRDYLAREARNISLGRAGEEFILKYEDWRLRSFGCGHLADRIEHTADHSDGAGFDIRSFDVDGRERFIEVKTTAYARETPFFVSKQELDFAKSNENSYKLYRVFEFRVSPRLFELSGRIDNHCLLDPVSYRAQFS